MYYSLYGVKVAAALADLRFYPVLISKLQCKLSFLLFDAIRNRGDDGDRILSSCHETGKYVT